MTMETFDQSDSGYPEEGPPGSAPDDDEGTSGRESAVRKHSETGADTAGSASDKATGNPKN
jgi:hypothetical protein